MFILRILLYLYYIRILFVYIISSKVPWSIFEHVTDWSKFLKHNLKIIMDQGTLFKYFKVFLKRFYYGLFIFFHTIRNKSFFFLLINIYAHNNYNIFILINSKNWNEQYFAVIIIIYSLCNYVTCAAHTKDAHINHYSLM